MFLSTFISPLLFDVIGRVNSPVPLAHGELDVR